MADTKVEIDIDLERDQHPTRLHLPDDFKQDKISYRRRKAAGDSRIDTVLPNPYNLNFHSLSRLRRELSYQAAVTVGNILREGLNNSWDAEEAQIERICQQVTGGSVAPGELVGPKLLLTMQLKAAELLEWPWEVLSLRNDSNLLGSYPNILFRYEMANSMTIPPQKALKVNPGRILVAWSNAYVKGGILTGFNRASYAKWVAAAVAKAEQFTFSENSDVIANASLPEIVSRLEVAQKEGPPIAVLHLACSGEWLPGRGYVIYLNELPNGERGVGIDAGTLQSVLRPFCDMVRLVVLCADESSGSGSERSAVPSIAWSLHKDGFQSVIGFRYLLDGVTAQIWTEELYGALLRNLCSLETALVNTRKKLIEKASGTAGYTWLGLQLFARKRDGSDTRPLTVRPYPGLRPFAESQGCFFFGRQADIDKSIDKLSRFAAQREPRLVVISGASGIGKSSLVRAGVAKVYKARNDQVLFLRPGECRERGMLPIEFLREQVTQWLAGAAHRDPKRRLLLVIDQLEEMVSWDFESPQSPPASEASVPDSVPRRTEAFLGEVHRLACDASQIDVVVALRSDFQSRFSDICVDAQSQITFGRYLSEEHYLFLDKPAQQQLRQIIEGPAKRVGLTLEPGLVDALLAEAQTQRGNLLPLLGYALDYLWEYRDDHGQLTHDIYNRELQQLSVVLTRQAQKVEAELLQGKTPEERDRQTRQLQRLLVKLVNLHEDSDQVTRRLVRTAEIQPKDSVDQRAFERALSLLAQHRLVVLAGSNEQTAELAHETLVGEWSTARAAIRERREQELKLRRLETDYELAITRNKSAPDLLQGLRLIEAQELLGQSAEEISPELRTYIEASIAAQQRRLQEEERQRQSLADKANFGQAVIELYKQTRSVRRQTRAALFLRAVHNLPEQNRWRTITKDTLRGPIAFGSIEQKGAVALDPALAVLVFSKGESITKEALRAGLVANGVEVPADFENQLAGPLPPSYPLVLSDLSSGAIAAVLVIPMLPEQMICSLADGILAGATRDGGICTVRIATGEFQLLPSAGVVHRMQRVPGGERLLALLDSAVLSIEQFVPLRLALFALPQEVMVRKRHTAPSVLLVGDDKPALRLAAQKPATEPQYVSEEPLVYFDPAGTCFAAVLSDNQVGIFELNVGADAVQELTQGVATELKPISPILRTKLAHEVQVRGALFRPDGQQLLTISADGLARVWNPASGVLVQTLRHPLPPAERDSAAANSQWAPVDIRASAWSDSGTRIATVCLSTADGADAKVAKLYLFDVGASPPGEPVAVELSRPGIQFPPSELRLGFANHDRLIIVYEPTGMVWIIQADDGSVLSHLPPAAIGSLMFSMDPGFRVQYSESASTLVTSGTKQSLSLYRIHCFTPLVTVTHPDLPIDNAGEMRVVAKDRMNMVRSVCLPADGKSLLTSSSDASVRSWPLGSQHASQSLSHKGTVWRVTLDAEEQRVLCAVERNSKAESAGEVVIWARPTGTLLDTFPLPEGARSAVTDSRGRYLLVASENGKQGWVRLFDLATHQELLIVPHPSVVSEAVFDPSGQYFLSACDDGIARLYSIEDLVPVLQLSHSPGHDVNSVCFAPELDGLLSASKDGTAVLWDRRTGERRREFKPTQPQPLYHITYRVVAEQTIVVTADDVGNVRIWDAGTGDSLGCIEHPGRVTHTTFDRSGALLATACEDGRGRVWRWREHTDAYLLEGIKNSTQLPGLPEAQSSDKVPAASAAD